MEQPMDVLKAMKDYNSSSINKMSLTDQENLKSKTVVLVLGASQTGKSTFQNFLANKELIPDGEGNILLKAGTDGLPIGNGIESCTKTPTLFEISGDVFIDCPGFGDTNSQDEILNSAQIKQLTTMCNNIKILLLVNYAVFKELYSEQERVYRNLFDLIGNSFSLTELQDTIQLIITQVDEQISSAQSTIKEDIKILRFDDEHKSLITVLSEKAQFFYKASTDNINNSTKDQAHHLSQIQRLRTLNIIGKSFNPVISDRVKVELAKVMLHKCDFAFQIIKNLASGIRRYDTIGLQAKTKQSESISILLQDLQRIKQDDAFYVFDLHNISNIISNWAKSTQYPVQSSDQQSLQEVNNIFQFFQHFKYCIKELKDRFPFEKIISQISDFNYQLKQQILILQQEEQANQQRLLQQQENIKQQHITQEEEQKELASQNLKQQQLELQYQRQYEQELKQQQEQEIKQQSLQKQQQLKQMAQQEQKEAQFVIRQMQDQSEQSQIEKQLLDQQLLKRQEVIKQRQQKFEQNRIDFQNEQMEIEKINRKKEQELKLKQQKSQAQLQEQENLSKQTSEEALNMMYNLVAFGIKLLPHIIKALD